MAALSVLDGPKDILRPVKSYQPCICSDIFTSFSFDSEVQEMYLQQIEVLKEEVKVMLTVSKESKIKDRIILIDSIERLGVSYHFQQQIEEQIGKIFIEFQTNFEDGNYDLFTTALGFRLFRQHGHNIPCSVFDKFKGKDNKFDINLNSDIKGLLSLYEATYLKFHGEDILEEAMVFTKYYLNDALPKLDDSLVLEEKVKQALVQPTHRGVPRVETRNYISIYEKEESKNQVLLRLAILDFNYVQNLHKKELRDLLMWWKEADLISKLPHVRDRVVECYFWGMAFNFEPLHSLSRLANAKALILLTIANDTYDRYATFQEIEICTQTLQRWDINEINDQLPDYMKIICRLLINTYDEEFENEVQIKLQGRSYAVTYARQAMQQLVRGYKKKASWQMGEEVPTFEDYMSYAVINSTCYLLLSSSFMGMESVTKEYFEWLNSEPKIVKAIGHYGRYMNDIASFQREHKEGLLATSIDCYKKEHGVSKQEAVDKFVELAEDCWMTINEERVLATLPSHDIIERVLNYARVTYVTYIHGEDGFTNPENVLRPHIIALFKDPITIISF